VCTSFAVDRDTETKSCQALDLKQHKNSLLVTQTQVGGKGCLAVPAYQICCLVAKCLFLMEDEARLYKWTRTQGWSRA